MQQALEVVAELHRLSWDFPKAAGDCLEVLLLRLFRAHGSSIFPGMIAYFDANDPKERKLLNEKHGIKLEGPQGATKGVDGVLQTQMGFTLVQIKISKTNQPDLETFLNEMARLNLKGYLITTGTFTEKFQRHNVVVYDRSTLLRWWIRFGCFFGSSRVYPERPPIKNPRGDQPQIYRQTRKYLKEKGSALMHLAPGYGKTFLAAWVAQSYQRILVVAPTIELTAQHYREWVSEFEGFPCQMICTRTKLASEGTTDPEQINRFHQLEKRLTFSTYKSRDLLKMYAFDLVVFDEAHFEKKLDWKGEFPTSHKLFTTATIQDHPLESDQVVRRTIVQAIEDKVLCDFKFVLAEYDSEETSDELSLEAMADLICQSFHKHGRQRMMVFGSTHASNKVFQKILEKARDQYQQQNPEWTQPFSIFRDKRKAHDGQALQKFQGDSGPAVLLSVRKYIQGLDVVSCDSICMLFVSTSYETLVQIMGRPLRTDPQNPEKKALVLLPFPCKSGTTSIREVMDPRYERSLRILLKIELGSEEFGKRVSVVRQQQSGGSSRGVFQEVEDQELQEIITKVQATLIDRKRLEYYVDREILALQKLTTAMDYEQFQKTHPEFPEHPPTYYDGENRGEFVSWSDFLGVVEEPPTIAQAKKAFRTFYRERGLTLQNIRDLSSLNLEQLWSDFQKTLKVPINHELSAIVN